MFLTVGNVSFRTDEVISVRKSPDNSSVALVVPNVLDMGYRPEGGGRLYGAKLQEILILYGEDAACVINYFFGGDAPADQVRILTSPPPAPSPWPPIGFGGSNPNALPPGRGD